MNHQDGLDQLVELLVDRGVPEYIRLDNGSEFSAREAAVLFLQGLGLWGSLHLLIRKISQTPDSVITLPRSALRREAQAASFKFPIAFRDAVAT